MSDIRIVHDDAADRYELYVGDDLASFADYRDEGDRRVIHHTETITSFRGRGLAARLVQFALDDVRERGQTVVPACWFVADFIRNNRQYGDLVA